MLHRFLLSSQNANRGLARLARYRPDLARNCSASRCSRLSPTPLHCRKGTTPFPRLGAFAFPLAGAVATRSQRSPAERSRTSHAAVNRGVRRDSFSPPFGRTFRQTGFSMVGRNPLARASSN
jgi:hypothetical protein